MILVIDANILFSALIKNSFTSELMLKNNLKLYSPEFILEEFFKYENYILKKTKRTKEEFIEIIHILKEIIIIIPKEDYSCFIKKAEKISPDPNDILYFALALKLNCPIWSNDKKLKEQNKILIYSTKDIIDILQLQSFPDHKIQ